MKSRCIAWSAALVALSMLAAPSAHAQADVMAGGYVLGSFPLGDWGETAGFGMGIDGTTIVRPNVEGPFAVRSSVGFLYNFSRTASVPPENLGPNSALNLETKNTSLYFGIGPEFGRPRGNINPFAFATAGVITYWTQSTLFGTSNGVPYEGDFGDSRIQFGWTAGFGFRRNLTQGTLGELSFEYRSGPGHKFVVPDGVDNSTGTLVVERPERSTDQIIVRFGTVLSAP